MAEIVLSITKPESLKEFKKESNHFDKIELRLDIFPFTKSYIVSLLENLEKDIILKFPKNIEVIKKYNTFFKEKNFLYDVDFDFFLKYRESLRLNREKLIISYHNFSSSDKLFEKFTQMNKFSVKYIKIIGTMKNVEDFSILEKIYENKVRNKKIISFLMGKGLAPLSRFISLKMGNPFFYTFFKDETAPGQISINDIKKDNLNLKNIDNQTKFYALIGNPITNSLSPFIHNTIFHEFKKNSLYLKMELENLSYKEIYLFSKYLKGLSITSPFKNRAIKFSHKLSPEAKMLKNVNTMKFEEKKVYGFNTDIYGFKKALSGFIKGEKIKNALVLGSGGSAKTIVYSLLSMGVKVYLHSRNIEKGLKISKLYNIKFLNLSEIKSYDLIVNCTTAGNISQVDEIPIPIDKIDSKYLFDLIYSPPITKLIKMAESKGIQTKNGIEMLIFQAIKQDIIWGIIKKGEENKLFEKILKLCTMK